MSTELKEYQMYITVVQKRTHLLTVASPSSDRAKAEAINHVENMLSTIKVPTDDEDSYVTAICKDSVSELDYEEISCDDPVELKQMLSLVNQGRIAEANDLLYGGE